MGCEPSKENNVDVVSVQTDDQFTISYKDMVTQDRGNFMNLYHLSTVLSRSSFSIVRKVISKASKQTRVCKIVPIAGDRFFKALSEVQFLKKLDHPNIIQVLEYFFQQSFLYIVMEAIPGSRILCELTNIDEGINFYQIMDIMSQLLRAVDFCHRKQISHRAITPQNILLFFDHGCPFLKLIDFSQACTIGCTKPPPIAQQKRNIILGSHQAFQTSKIDIYDCGVVFYTLITGDKLPAQVLGHNYEKMCDNAAHQIQKLRLDSKISEDFINLMKMILQQNPQARPTALECLNHRFFTHLKIKKSSKNAVINMIEFKPQKNLNYLFSLYASLTLTSPLQKMEHLSSFYSLDTNKDGEIQLDQLIQGIMDTYEIDKEKAKAYANMIFENLDKNKSGSINFSEYITSTIMVSKLVSNDFLKTMFMEMDTNSDGHISETQLNNLIMGINRYQVHGQQKVIDFTTFKKIMLNLIDQQNKIKIC